VAIKNYILEHPFFYRLYQSIVRTKKNEYLFFNYIFSRIAKKKPIRMLDICSGDSHVLSYVNEHVDDYLGIGNNEKYLKDLSKKWSKYKFLNLDVEKQETLKIINDYEPNFIFINGAIHHLDDTTINSIKFLVNKFKNSFFLSVDPIRFNNNFINKIMINMDRGKFIRTDREYKKLMNNFEEMIVDDFYIMSFMNIFHYKNFDLKEYYNTWKKI
jgi:hypothetical protein